MEHFLKQFPLVVRREHPELNETIDYFLRKGLLVPVLPGIHRWAESEETFELRAEAAHKWQVNGVLCGSTAARLTWWPELQDGTVRMAGSLVRRGVAWLVASRHKLPDELITTHEAIRVAGPDLSVLQMSAGGDANPICEGIRREVVTLASLKAAYGLFPKRSRGMGVVGQLLSEARAEPWSSLELEAHSLLRKAGVDGWRTNVEVWANGKQYFADILFHRERLIVEIDGRSYHSHAELDEDNTRRNDLVAAGWRVVNFSGAILPLMLPTILPMLKEARGAWRAGLPLLPLTQGAVKGDDGSHCQDAGGWDAA